MFVCRLFHRDQPFEQLDSRLLADGQVRVGRDPSADWPVNDPNATLSRIHFTLSVEAGELLLTDESTNGTFLRTGARAPKHQPVKLALRDTINFGTLTMLIDASVDQGINLNGTQILPLSMPQPLPSDWIDGTPASRPPHLDESLIEAFCEGARIDSSVLSGEDPADVMRRLGALYQQTILGLAALMGERARFKADHQLDGTKIGAAENNPFKWTPSRQLAVSLLCSHDLGFLTGADAVRASFDDIADHIAGVSEGANAALQQALSHLSPAEIEAEVIAAGFSLRGRAAVARDVHDRRYGELTRPNSTIVRDSFEEAYRRAGERRAAL